MSKRKIKYNLQLTMVARLSENVDIIPLLIQQDLINKFPKHTITNRKDLEKIMAEYLSEQKMTSYDIYKDFINDSMGEIFILIDNE